MFLGDLPVTKEMINEITANAKKTINNVLPISIDRPATPPAPSKNAPILRVKNGLINFWRREVSE